MSEEKVGGSYVFLVYAVGSLWLWGAIDGLVAAFKGPPGAPTRPVACYVVPNPQAQP